MIPAASNGVFRGKTILFQTSRFLKLFPFIREPRSVLRGIARFKPFNGQNYTVTGSTAKSILEIINQRSLHHILNVKREEGKLKPQILKILH